MEVAIFSRCLAVAWPLYVLPRRSEAAMALASKSYARRHGWACHSFGCLPLQAWSKTVCVGSCYPCGWLCQWRWFGPIDVLAVRTYLRICSEIGGTPIHPGCFPWMCAFCSDSIQEVPDTWPEPAAQAGSMFGTRWMAGSRYWGPVWAERHRLSTTHFCIGI